MGTVYHYTVETVDVLNLAKKLHDLQLDGLEIHKVVHIGSEGLLESPEEEEEGEEAWRGDREAPEPLAWFCVIARDRLGEGRRAITRLRKILEGEVAEESPDDGDGESLAAEKAGLILG
jgi:hypothetical protein